MKSLIEICNKKYDKKLCEHEVYKQQMADMKECLKANNILCSGNQDSDFFRYELIYNSILIKQQFEDTFFDTYVEMFDYWYDLTYLERKKQMNVEISALVNRLKSFSYNQETIFMPCFDPNFNHLYTTEIVLLDLKQYHVFIRDFHKEVKEHLYGILPYRYGFTSCQVIAEMDDRFVLYHPHIHRFYLYERNVCSTFLSLDDKSENLLDEELKTAAMLLLLNREKDLAEFFIQGSLVNEKMKKQIVKILKKQAKKDKNNSWKPFQSLYFRV